MPQNQVETLLLEVVDEATHSLSFHLSLFVFLSVCLPVSLSVPMLAR